MTMNEKDPATVIIIIIRKGESMVISFKMKKAIYKAITMITFSRGGKHRRFYGAQSSLREVHSTPPGCKREN